MVVQHRHPAEAARRLRVLQLLQPAAKRESEWSVFVSDEIVLFVLRTTTERQAYGWWWPLVISCVRCIIENPFYGSAKECSTDRSKFAKCQPVRKSPSRIERRNSRHPSADRKSRRSRSPPSISASFNRPNSSEWDDDGDRSKWPHQAAASKSANRIGRIESDVCCGRAWIEGHSKIAKANRDLSEWPPVWVGKPKQLCCSFQFWTVRLSAKEKSLSASRTDWPRST